MVLFFVDRITLLSLLWQQVYIVGYCTDSAQLHLIRFHNTSTPLYYHCWLRLFMWLNWEITWFQLPGAISSFSPEDSFQKNDRSLEETINYPLLKTQSSSLSEMLKDSFKKSDSFTRWMSKALGEVDDSQIKSSSGVYWNSEETDNIIEASTRDQLDQFTLDPVLAQDQLFSIVDFSPSWTYARSKTRVCLLKLFICSWLKTLGSVIALS